MGEEVSLEANGWFVLIALSLAPSYSRAEQNGFSRLALEYGFDDATEIVSEIQLYLADFGIQEAVEPLWHIDLPAGESLDSILRHAAQAPMHYPPQATHEDFLILRSWMMSFYRDHRETRA